MRAHVERVWGWDDDEQAIFFDARFRPSSWQVVHVGDVDVGVLVVEEDAERLFLAEIELLPAWQGRGIGSAIVRSLMREAATRGKPLSLRVLHVNARAKDLYARLGFAQVSEIETHAYLRWAAPPAT